MRPDSGVARLAPATGLAVTTLAVAFGLPASGLAQLPDSTTVTDSAAVADSPVLADPALAPRVSPQIAADLYAMTHASADTPYGMGLIPTGLVEARIAEAFVRIAGQDSADVRAMKANMVHVLHAIDPEQAVSGRGLGYGFRRAAEGVRLHIDRVAADPSASPTVLYHAPFVRDAATNALTVADDAVALARSIQASPGTDPGPLLNRLEDLAALIRTMAGGSDRDRDGRIGHTASETGLARAAYHLELVRRVEGLDPVPPLPGDLPIPAVRSGAGGGR